MPNKSWSASLVIPRQLGRSMPWAGAWEGTSSSTPWRSKAGFSPGWRKTGPSMELWVAGCPWPWCTLWLDQSSDVNYYPSWGDLDSDRWQYDIDNFHAVTRTRKLLYLRSTRIGEWCKRIPKLESYRILVISHDTWMMLECNPLNPPNGWHKWGSVAMTGNAGKMSCCLGNRWLKRKLWMIRFQ